MNTHRECPSPADRRNDFRRKCGSVDARRVSTPPGSPEQTSPCQPWQPVPCAWSVAAGESLPRGTRTILDADVILLAPDGEADTVAAAHMLSPSYLGRTDGDLDRGLPVLRRWIEKRVRIARDGEPA